jgi:hypothetical protein
MVRSRRFRINRHLDLKKHYEEARRTASSKLNIVFINSDVASSTNQDPIAFDDNWTSYGKWQGNFNSGWPGGARVRKASETWRKPLTLTEIPASLGSPGPRHSSVECEVDVDNTWTSVNIDTPPSHRTTRRPSQSESPGPTRHSSVGSDGDGDNIWTSVTSNSFPSHRTRRPSQSSMKPPETAGIIRRSVQFSEKFEAQLFVCESSPSEKIVMASWGGIVSNSPEEALIDAVQNKSCKELIRVLQSGACSDQKVSEFSLEEQYRKVKEDLSGVERKLAKGTSDDLLVRKKDLIAKKTVLNIYLNVCYLIEKAMSLQHWTTFEIRVRSIELRKNSSIFVQERTKKLCAKVKVHYCNICDELVSFCFCITSCTSETVN